MGNKAVLYADRLYMEQEIHNRSSKLGRFLTKWEVESTVYRLAVVLTVDSSRLCKSKVVYSIRSSLEIQFASKVLKNNKLRELEMARPI